MTATPSTSASTKSKKKKKKISLTRGQAHIMATYNNTIVTISDVNGNVVAWSSSGKMGFKGPKKSTPYAAGIVVRDVVEQIKDIGLKDIEVYVRGIGSGREASIRALSAHRMNILLIKDVTPMAHNGPRPRKPRRV